ncbi:MAG: hypothetical protein ABR507_02360 [Actinomycetota bacterium]|nr:hypothetical protein [Actinomycetota bacterium]
MKHRVGDVFNPPGLTNFLGCVQADFDVTAIRSLNFPPYGSGDTITGGLYINGRYLPTTGAEVTHVWFPDRIVRTAKWDSWAITTTTVMPFGEQAVVVSIEFANQRSERRHVEVSLALKAGVTKAVRPWTDAFPPMGTDHSVTVDQERRAVVFSAKDSTAVSLQGCVPRASWINENKLSFDLDVDGSSSTRIMFIVTIADSASEAASSFDRIAAKGSDLIKETREAWQREIEAVFTKDSGVYSGSLPILETSDPDMARIYNMGVMGVLYFKRESPHSILGRTYDTLMPRYWQSVTFLWDFSLSSLVHTLLDPTTMRKHLEHWMATDIHKYFGTEWITGGGVGGWYSVNDYAMTKMINDYLRWTGDTAWLDSSVGTSTPISFLEDYANAWEGFKSPNGLADYGGIGNLLECVSTYIHEVASLNAANIFNLRTAARVMRFRGDDNAAAKMEASAKSLLGEVMKLYSQGDGFFNARYPDGRLVPVRHCYDFITVTGTIGEELSDVQKKEMARFFTEELRTPVWMRALSSKDDDASFSLRPDHQWTGAYPAWPPQAVSALWKIGEIDAALEWLRGLSKSANQGPFGQAHFVESFMEPEDGGALKATPETPYINDWTCSSNGAWVNIFIESIFGITAGLDSITAEPRFGAFDPDARLVGIGHQGRMYDADKRGLHPQ